MLSTTQQEHRGQEVIRPSTDELSDATEAIIIIIVSGLGFSAPLLKRYVWPKLKNRFKRKIKNKIKADKNLNKKHELVTILSAIRYLSNSHYACLGLLHNGTYAGTGYSLSRVSWELESTAPGLTPLMASGTIQNYPFNSWLASGWTLVDNKYLIWPIYLNNIQIGILLLSSFYDVNDIEINSNKLELAINDLENRIIIGFLKNKQS